MTRQSKKNTVRGFTLIEMAIVIAVIGVMVGATAQALDVWWNRSHLDQQTERLTTIHAAIASYLGSHSHLPCPAPYNLSQSNAAFGVGVVCDATTAATVTRVAGRMGMMVRIGAVPVRDLGLSNSYSADPWGYKFTYAVTEGLTTTYTEVNGPPADPTNGTVATGGAIDVVDGNNTTVLPRGVAGTALYALVDHGRNGAGAYTADAGVLHAACPASGPEQENCDGNTAFRAMPISTSTDPTKYFDDVAQYRTTITATISGSLPTPPSCTGANVLQWTGAAWACNPPGPPPNLVICTKAVTTSATLSITSDMNISYTLVGGGGGGGGSVNVSGGGGGGGSTGIKKNGTLVAAANGGNGGGGGVTGTPGGNGATNTGNVPVTNGDTLVVLVGGGGGGGGAGGNTNTYGGGGGGGYYGGGGGSSAVGSNSTGGFGGTGGAGGATGGTNNPAIGGGSCTNGGGSGATGAAGCGNAGNGSANGGGGGGLGSGGGGGAPNAVGGSSGAGGTAGGNGNPGSAGTGKGGAGSGAGHGGGTSAGAGSGGDGGSATLMYLATACSL